MLTLSTSPVSKVHGRWARHGARDGSLAALAKNAATRGSMLDQRITNCE
ncbi:MAG: hypothetical protein H6713_10560 [Myxococcales bacterium]|nr:hypothetical protein [Myxococcales bacterium]MCB9750418.1 hypothetical protein [Myxococcales bacterium]